MRYTRSLPHRTAWIVQFTASAAIPPDPRGRNLQEPPSGACPCKSQAGPVVSTRLFAARWRRAAREGGFRMTPWTRTSPALVVLAIAGLLLGPGAPAWGAAKATARTHKKASSRTAAKKPAAAPKVTDFATGQVLLDAQASYSTAQAHYRVKRYADAVEALDPAIASLGDAMSSSRDARLRSEAGDLFKKCG